MKSFIGSAEVAKFILFKVDMGDLLPPVSEVKKSLKTTTAKYYKSTGHYADEIRKMSGLLDVIYSGLTLNSDIRNTWYGNNVKYITAILRLDDDAKRDTFFDLKYSDIIVDYLTLSHEAMQDLLELSRGAYDLISKLDKVYDLREEINKLDAVINKKKILDDTIKKASDTLESEYFINFGKPALQIADKHFRDWYAKYKWAH